MSNDTNGPLGRKIRRLERALDRIRILANNAHSHTPILCRWCEIHAVANEALDGVPAGIMAQPHDGDAEAANPSAVPTEAVRDEGRTLGDFAELSMRISDDLRPCPFCGSPHVSLGQGEQAGESHFFIECEGCGAAAGWNKDADAAAAKWNAVPSTSVPESKTDAGREGELSFAELRAANLARQQFYRTNAPEKWKIEGEWSLNDWFTALMGEVGEAANIAKKVKRGDFTLDEARPEMSKELADAQTYLDLLAHNAGIDLGAATAAKWNAVSERAGYSGKIAARTPTNSAVPSEPRDQVGETLADKFARTVESAAGSSVFDPPLDHDAIAALVNELLVDVKDFRAVPSELSKVLADMEADLTDRAGIFKPEVLSWIARIRAAAGVSVNEPHPDTKRLDWLESRAVGAFAILTVRAGRIELTTRARKLRAAIDAAVSGGTAESEVQS